MKDLQVSPLTAQDFAPFGDVIQAHGAPDKLINQGQCGRYNDLAKLEFLSGQAGVSVFDAQPRMLPYVLDMVERHPEGAQAFLPMTQNPFLVIVAPDVNGQPGIPRAFVTQAGQGVNYHRNTWHGVLTPLSAPGLFAVVDRIGDETNLEEFWFDTPYRIVET